MSHLDWYLRLDERSRERGYDLCLLIRPYPETVVREIIPRAVEIACKNARKQNRRDESRRKRWKLCFTDPQLYQISILEASHSHAKQAGSSLANWLIRYIGFLSLCTLQRNSFYVAVGFERILNTGTAKDILELYEWLTYRISPARPPVVRDEKSAVDISSSLHEQIYREFKDGFQTSGRRLTFDKIPKGSGGFNDEIYQILDQMIPWETDHLAAQGHLIARDYQTTMAEMSLAHVCIDQQRCLENVKRENKHISDSFDTWEVPIPNSAGPVEPSGAQMPRWSDVEEEIMKEIHWSEERSKRGWGSVFEVVVDGEIKDSIARGGSIEMSLPPFARYVEVRDAESKIMLANCHLMDPHDLPDAGWKRSTKVPAGGRIKFEFFPDQSGNEMAGLLLRLGIDARPAWLTSIRNLTEQILQPRAWNTRTKSLAWIACAASLALALSITLAAIIKTTSDLREQVSHLQQENSDLQAQVSTIPDLDAEIAKLRQSKTSNPNSSVQEALYDGSELVAVDGQGNLTGVESIPQRFRRMIRTALMTGQVEAPELRTLGGGAAKLMGENGGPETFTLISPVGVVIETDRPTFRWRPLKGAVNYTVIISDSSYNEVASGKALSATQWTIDQRLERGKVYSWQVIALNEGKEIKSPSAPGIIAKFEVLNQVKADDLAHAKKAHPDSHLLKGLLYVRAGLLDEAEREFKTVLAANPKSNGAKRLLRNVQALRRAK